MCLKAPFISDPAGRLTALVAATLLLGPSVRALTRVPNTTLNVPLEPQSGTYALTNAFGNLTFTRPVAMVTPPGETNRLFVVERQGVVSVITNLASPNRTVFMDLTDRVEPQGNVYNEHGLLGLVFHPGYATNGYLYVFYTGDATTAAGAGVHDILSRFEVDSGNPNAGDTSSELRLIIQRDEENNHNAGDLHFGPEGYLYVSLGDEGDHYDSRNNSQRIDKDFFSGILRIDVDKRPGSLTPNSHAASTTNYTIPPDNPFIGATNFNGITVNSNNVRTEFWAVGLRNPWRMSFDSYTGLLYAGDAGQDAWEEVNLITKGGNYGWAYREGTVPGPKSNSAPVGFTSLDPLLRYPRGSGTFEGRAVVGGVVYRGTELPELYGTYIFGDFGFSYVTPNDSKIWFLRHSGTNVTEWTHVATLTGLGAIGTDPRNGDILAAPVADGVLQRLVRATTSGTPPPALLSGTGVFSDLQTLTPQAGVVPYDLNLSFWSDNALKSRWFSVPDPNQFITFSRESNWLFPTGTVWIKHFELELTNGLPASRRRLETRLLVKNSNLVHGFTYRWGTSTNDATLVDESGMNESFVIDDGGGMLRTQVWHYPARSECLACHTEGGGFGLGFNTAQLNRNADMGGGQENQVQALSEAGYFTGTISNRHLLPFLASLSDTNISLEHRVRGYFAANCAQCHSPGTTFAMWDAHFATPTADAAIIEGELVNDGGNSSNRFIARGSLDLSMALDRISTRGLKQMPPLGSSVVDTQAVALLSAWITNDLPSHQTFAEWQVAEFGATNAPGAGVFEDFDGDGDGAYLEFLNGTDPKQAASRWRISSGKSGTNMIVSFPRKANRGYEVQYADRFTNASAWMPLNVTSNAPTFRSGDTTWAVPDGIDPGADTRYYRVEVYER